MILSSAQTSCTYITLTQDLIWCLVFCSNIIIKRMYILKTLRITNGQACPLFWGSTGNTICATGIFFLFVLLSCVCSILSNYANLLLFCLFTYVFWSSSASTSLDHQKASSQYDYFKRCFIYYAGYGRLCYNNSLNYPYYKKTLLCVINRHMILKKTAPFLQMPI